jgi:hypothetical protein
MANHVLTTEATFVPSTTVPAVSAGQLDRTTTAFGLAAAVTCVFNTLLAWIKDAYEPLNSFMASLTGHHWTTHGIADVLLFVALGFALLNTGIPDRVSARGLVTTLIASVVGSGLGLLVWFVLV